MGYTVQRGDSWARIAGIVYGDQRMFQALMSANPGIGVLQPGMTINTPARQESPVVTINPADIQVEGVGGVNPYSQEGQHLLSQGSAPSPAQSLTAQILGTGAGERKVPGESTSAFASYFTHPQAPYKPSALMEVPGAVADLFGNLFGNLFGPRGKEPTGPPPPYSRPSGRESGASRPYGYVPTRPSTARPEPSPLPGAALLKALGMSPREGLGTIRTAMTTVGPELLLERARGGAEALLRMSGAGWASTWATIRARSMWENGDPAAGITPEMVHQRYGTRENFMNEVRRQTVQQTYGGISLIDQEQPGAAGAAPGAAPGMTPAQMRTWAARYTAQTVQQYLTPGSPTYGDRDRGLPDVIGTDVANQVADWYIRRFGGELAPGGDEDARAAVLTSLGYSYDPNATGGLGDMGAWIRDTWIRPYSGAYAFGYEPRDGYGYGYDGGSFPRQYSQAPTMFNWNIRIT